MLSKIQDHLNSYNLDVRESHNGRWIDQKCTIDIISLIADCIIQFVGDNTDCTFTTKDIWFSEYSVENVQSIFVKPDPTNKSKHEYDKLFSQPLKLLGYSRVLTETKVGNRNVYSINNMEILHYISIRESNALEFMNLYITKVLTASGIMDAFEDFFRIQTADAYNSVRNTYFNFTKNNTAINGDLECGRIFTKVINILAYKRRKHGTIKGRISNEIITRDELLYNRKNWRDENSGKPKSVSRNEFPVEVENAMSTYQIQRAKRQLHEFNDRYRNSMSEVLENGTYEPKAVHMHHIFPASEFPTIAAYLENLIALTPNQHLLCAHPNSQTTHINRDYQYLCLVCKAGHIKDNLESNIQEHIYVFTDYMFVLNTGFGTEDFNIVRENDFATVISMIDERMVRFISKI